VVTKAACTSETPDPTLDILGHQIAISREKSNSPWSDSRGFMTKLFEEEEKRAASHEAGHAVISVHLEVPFECVEINADGEGRPGPMLREIDKQH
jgi:hypothetical protein